MIEQIIEHLLHSDNTAFVISDKSHSYKDLGLRVKKYCQYLYEHHDNDLLGIVMHDDIETYAFIIATFLSNCGYVILNLAYPPDRLIQISTSSNISHVVSSIKADSEKVPDFLSFIGMDSIPEPLTDMHFRSLEPLSTAYIVYTSGSTGKPKGVKITKKNLEAFLQSLFGTTIEYRETDSVLQMFDLTFDASILMLLPSLCVGATIYTINPASIKIIDIARVLTTYPITFIFLVPSVISLLKSYISSLHLPSVKTLLIGAEPVTKTLVDMFKPSIPNAKIWNIYGPTETTVIVFTKQLDVIRTDELYNDIIPIGKPMPGVKHLILDDNRVVTEIGQKGELLIGGPQVSEGYLNDEEKNTESFHYLNYNGQVERFYASGDIVFMNEKGDYSYCERKDFQAKIQGLRIELNEIEYHTSKFTGKRSIAIVKTVDGNQQLFLFIENYQGSHEDVVGYLGLKLPPYMVPKNIVNIDQFPLNVNDKIDRNKLSGLT